MSKKLENIDAPIDILEEDDSAPVEENTGFLPIETYGRDLGSAVAPVVPLRRTARPVDLDFERHRPGFSSPHHLERLDQ